MKIDILQHNLVPEHVILSEEEAEQVFTENDFEVDQMPKILPNDPVVKAIGAKEVDLIKITGKSETAGIFTKYRIVRK